MDKGLSIEKESFDIIEQNVDLSKFSDEEKVVVKRVIHASGDFDFAKLIIFSNNWLTNFKKIMQTKPAVVCDVNMVKAGITDKYLKVSGLKTHCFISDENIKDLAKLEGKTRAETSIEHAFENFDNIIFVIGNAPTALLKVIELNSLYTDKNIFVVGFPVGFVKAAESKKMLTKTDIPFITNKGTKGGSGIAAAAFNAMIKVCFNV
ncbi:precorrin-8X methylmutase [Deferribacter thermophilus]|uniref:precorrin-8X methylmutase n=1 Tax=Deferribacter thermophilus TaxID=53573 RepID=UPI003C274F18